MIADAEGRNERVLATRQLTDGAFFSIANPGAYGTRVVWSPDGAVIASSGVGFPGGVLTGYAMFTTVADGSVQTFVRTPPGQMAWIDNTSLLHSPGDRTRGSSYSRGASRIRPVPSRALRTISTAILSRASSRTATVSQRITARSASTFGLVMAAVPTTIDPSCRGPAWDVYSVHPE